MIACLNSVIITEVEIKSGDTKKIEIFFKLINLIDLTNSNNKQIRDPTM